MEKRSLFLMKSKKNNARTAEGHLELERHERDCTFKITIIMSLLLTSAVIICILSGRYTCTRLEILRCFGHGIIQLLLHVLELPGRIIPGLHYSLTNPIQVTWPTNVEIVLWSVRIPRIIAVILVGGGLSISGANYQGLFKKLLVMDGMHAAPKKLILHAVRLLLWIKSQQTTGFWIFAAAPICFPFLWQKRQNG